MRVSEIIQKDFLSSMKAVYLETKEIQKTGLFDEMKKEWSKTYNVKETKIGTLYSVTVIIVTARSRSGVWLSSDENRTRTWLQPQIPEMVTR